jgi:hypothetical protein
MTNETVRGESVALDFRPAPLLSDNAGKNSCAPLSYARHFSTGCRSQQFPQTYVSELGENYSRITDDALELGAVALSESLETTGGVEPFAEERRLSAVCHKHRRSLKSPRATHTDAAIVHPGDRGNCALDRGQRASRQRQRNRLDAGRTTTCRTHVTLVRLDSRECCRSFRP